MMKKNSVIILSAIAMVIVVAAGIIYLQKKNEISPAEAKSIAEKFISENLLKEGMKVSIKEITREGEVYKMKIDVQGNEFFSYLSSDGNQFFPEGYNIKELEGKAKGEPSEAQETAAKEVPKNDVPEVELFVMSYCPYGTQIEKGILPAVETLGSKIKFNLKFVDYAMHDEAEVTENLRQYCIQKEEPQKLTTYLACFLKAGNATDCLKSEQVNLAKNQSCMNTTDQEFKIYETLKDKNAWGGSTYPPFNVHQQDNAKYGVEGSPTLVVNGVTVSSNRDSLSLLKAICGGFSTQPEECKKELSAASPSAGFGEGTGTDASGGCAN